MLENTNSNPAMDFPFGWEDVTGSGYETSLERDGWRIIRFHTRNQYRVYAPNDDRYTCFMELDRAVNYANGEIDRNGDKRYPYLRCFADITSSDPQTLAREYASLVQELKAGRCGEFTERADMIRYMKVVSAIGMFQYSTTFPAALRDMGVAMEDMI